MKLFFFNWKLGRNFFEKCSIFLGCNTTVYSIQIRFLGFSKGLTSYIILFGLGRRSKAKVHAANLRRNSISECLFVVAC